jgi:hypothetical protein
MDLRLEGLSEPVAAVDELAIRFSDFRWHREGASRPTATEEDSRVPAEAAQAIAAIRERLQFVYFITAEHIQYPPWKLGRLCTHVADLALATAPPEEQINVADVRVHSEP